MDLADADSVGRALENVHCAVCAAGPFQTLPMTLVEACCERRIPYVDLSDDRGFCARLRERVRAAPDPPLVATGWSAVPALTGALSSLVVSGWEAVERIDLAIAPGNRMPRATGTVASLLDSLGKPFRVWRNAEWREVTGWSEPRVFDFPQPVGPRRGWLVDVPAHDEVLFGARTFEFRVGAELGILNRCTSVLATCVRRGWVRSWVPWTRVFRRCMALFGWLGHEHGAVGVTASGKRGGRRVRGRACVVADVEAPRVPVMPATELVRRIVDGRESRTGLLPSSGWIDGDGLERACAERGYRLVVEEVRQDA